MYKRQELRCKTFGFIFQRYNLLNSLKASENAALPAVYLGLNAEARDRRAVELLKKLDLGNKLANRPNELSGGQQQRLCIARALAISPSILLMDEPTSALDPISTGKIEDLIHELKKEYTIVIVTHNMQQAARVSDKTGYFYLGELIEYGETRKIFTNPEKESTQNYITGRFG